MKNVALSILLVSLFCAVPGVAENAQTTPASLVAAYEGLADVILGARVAEENLVMSILDAHYATAKRAMKNGNWDTAGAQMVLFANEGDNAVAGVRKGLLQGGHHFNTDDAEDGGKYEPGFVVVGKVQKRKMMSASKNLLQAKDDAGREAAWAEFQTVVDNILE